MARTLAASAFPRIPVLRKRSFCAGLLAENMWRAYACLNLTLPVLVTEKRLAAVRLVLIFGMVDKYFFPDFFFSAEAAAPTCFAPPSAAHLPPSRYLLPAR